nr:ethylene-responsive transcription factor ERF071 [Tanacetum cinerariifolium]
MRGARERAYAIRGGILHTVVVVAPPKEQQVSIISTTTTGLQNANWNIYKPWIHGAVAYCKATDQLPRGWKYDPETFFMAYVPKPPTPPKPKPKPKKKKKKKKKIKIAWSSYNYHGSYPMNKDEQKIWNLFRMKDKVKANKLVQYPRNRPWVKPRLESEFEYETVQAPSEIPKRLYDLIQNATRARKSLKLNSNNMFVKPT